MFLSSCEDRFDEIDIDTVAALDVHVDEEEHAGLRRPRPAVAALQLPDLAVLETAIAESPVGFAYQYAVRSSGSTQGSCRIFPHAKSPSRSPGRQGSG